MQNGNGNRLEVIINGRPVTEYRHDDGSYFIEGRKNSEYKIRFFNDSGTRKKIVVSVDGLNVVSGDTDWSHGYCVEPWSKIEIPGWRKNDQNVASFKFSRIGKSYNQHNDSGDARNIGVIGCKVFDEQIKYQQYHQTIKHIHYDYPTWDHWKWSNSNIRNDGHETYTSGLMRGLTAKSAMNNIQIGASVNYLSSSQACADVSSAEPSQSVGTEYGRNKEFKTHDVYYDFNDYASATLNLFYDSKEGLDRRGIDVYERPRYNRRPEAFPVYNGVRCPDPR